MLSFCAYADDESLREQVETLKATVDTLQAIVQSQSKEIEAQGKRIRELETTIASARQSPTDVASLPRPSAPTAGLSAFNPEIGVLADVVGQISESSAEGEGNDKLSVRELELIFGHPIDPYSRFDATLAFSDFEEQPSIEEAYITHWGIPAGIKARLGRLRPKVGKASSLHRDSLDSVDEPLVVSKYLGAEGLFRTAGEVSLFLPTPWTAVTNELAGGIMEGGVGEGGTLFGSTTRHPSFYAHLKNFWEISDVSTLELGATHLIGSKDADAALEVNLFGLDATFIHYATSVNKLKLQTEAYLQERDESEGFDNNPWGIYSLIDYRLSPRFGFGGRFDYVEPVDVALSNLSRNGDIAWAYYFTFYQSEFARWRLEGRHTEFAEGGDDNTFFLQGTVAIGVHKHQLQ